MSKKRHKKKPAQHRLNFENQQTHYEYLHLIYFDDAKSHLACHPQEWQPR